MTSILPISHLSSGFLPFSGIPIIPCYRPIISSLVKELITLIEISAHTLSIDSYPLPANVKQNNLKTTVKERFDNCCIQKLIQTTAWESLCNSYSQGKKSPSSGDTEIILSTTCCQNFHSSKPQNQQMSLTQTSSYLSLNNPKIHLITPHIVLCNSKNYSEKILSFVINELKTLSSTFETTSPSVRVLIMALSLSKNNIICV